MKTVSELVRDAIQSLLDGGTDSDKQERDAAIEEFFLQYYSQPNQQPHTPAA